MITVIDINDLVSGFPNRVISLEYSKRAYPVIVDQLHNAFLNKNRIVIGDYSFLITSLTSRRIEYDIVIEVKLTPVNTTYKT